MSSVLSLDPGIEMGYAYWPNSHWKYKKAPQEADCIIPCTSVTWQRRFEDLMGTFQTMLRKWQPTFVVVEEPMFFGAGSEASAAAGSLIKLAAVYGGLMAVAATQERYSFQIVSITVAKWKGQLPKPVVQNRLKEIYQDQWNPRWSSHAVDAIGIGTYYMGLFE